MVNVNVVADAIVGKPVVMLTFVVGVVVNVVVGAVVGESVASVNVVVGAVVNVIVSAVFVLYSVPWSLL